MGEKTKGPPRFHHLFKRFRSQMAAFLIVTTILPVLLVQLINYVLTMDIISEKNSGIFSNNLVLSRNNADAVLGGYSTLLFQICTDEAFQEYLDVQSLYSQDSVEYTRNMEKIEQRIFAHIVLHPEVQAVGFVDRESRHSIISQKRPQDQPAINYFSRNALELHREMIDTPFSHMASISSQDPDYDPENPLFYLTSRVINNENLKLLGSITLFLRPTSLNSAINNQSYSNYEFSDKLIVTWDGQILCSKENLTGYPLSVLQERNPYLKDWDLGSPYEDDHVLVQAAPMEGFSLYLLDIVDKRALLRDVQDLWILSFACILAVMAVTLVVAHLSSKRTVSSINRMTNLMNQLDSGNLDMEVTDQSDNQIRSIEVSFNHMVRRIRRLLEENREQYDQILAITEASQQAELKSLELQINPHFLFNTIDSINWMAIRKGDYEISEELGKLAYILRYTVYNMNGIVTVAQELEWVHHYLDLQQTRFHYNFEYRVRVQKEAGQCQIHKLLLQPFLENSIIHGFQGIDYPGELFVDIRLDNRGGFLVMKVTDNGTGISAAKAQALRELFAYRNDPTQEESIGMQNIAMRMRGYYGERAAVELESRPGSTHFTIMIPKEQVVNTHVPDSDS